MMLVQSCRRLHFGLFSPRPVPELGLAFGGIGVMVDAIGVKLSARRHPGWEFTGQESARVERYATALCKKVPEICPLHLNVEYVAPVHQGWGTGTQLALAVAKACYESSNLSWTATEAAKILGRGKRSSIGTAGFQRGGFLLDRGRPSDLIMRVTLPASWTWVLIEPGHDQGLHADAERLAFSRLPDVDLTIVMELQDLAERITNAAMNNDFKAFAEMLTVYNRRAGTHYFSLQQGDYSSPLNEHRLSIMASHGALGRGQSSWGPGLFAVFPDRYEAERFLTRCQLSDCTTHVAATFEE